MIDASTFATEYAGFWRGVTPTSELFVRRVNLPGGYERWARPLPVKTARRAALMSETAFEFFVRELQRMPIKDGPVLNAVAARLSLHSEGRLDINPELDEEERQEVEALAARLAIFFEGARKPTTLKPLFPGCGFVDASEGDVLSGSTLFEIKSVSRAFRGIDFRQLLVYAALNYASSRYSIDSVGLCNPRLGTAAVVSLSELAFEVSGMSDSTLLGEILYAISSGGISR